MDDKEKIIKKLQEELKGIEEQKNKKLIKYMYIFMFFSLFFFFQYIHLDSFYNFLPKSDHQKFYNIF